MQYEESAPATRDLFGEVTELLLAGGYFRARIADLTPFDKARDRAAGHARPNIPRVCPLPTSYRS